MHKKGISVDGKTYDEKFRRMKTNYTKLHDQSKQTGRGPVRWKWFKDMENIIHIKDTASPPNGSISCTDYDFMGTQRYFFTLSIFQYLYV